MVGSSNPSTGVYGTSSLCVNVIAADAGYRVYGAGANNDGVHGTTTNGWSSRDSARTEIRNVL